MKKSERKEEKPSSAKGGQHPHLDRDRIQIVQQRIRYATFLILAILAAFLFYGYRRKWFSSPKPLQDFILGLGPIGYLLAITLIILNTLFPVIPGALPQLATFMAYGGWLGYSMALIASIIGSVISFLIAKHYGDTFVKAFVPDDLFHKIRDKIKDEKTASLLLLIAYLVPGFPDDATTMVVGLTDMKLSRFILLCFIAKPLPTFAYLFGITSLLDWLVRTFLA